MIKWTGKKLYFLKTKTRAIECQNTNALRNLRLALRLYIFLGVSHGQCTPHEVNEYINYVLNTSFSSFTNGRRL